jgi:hypothetical protein
MSRTRNSVEKSNQKDLYDLKYGTSAAGAKRRVAQLATILSWTFGATDADGKNIGTERVLSLVSSRSTGLNVYSLNAIKSLLEMVGRACNEKRGDELKSLADMFAEMKQINDPTGYVLWELPETTVLTAEQVRVIVAKRYPERAPTTARAIRDKAKALGMAHKLKDGRRGAPGEPRKANHRARR